VERQNQNAAIIDASKQVISEYVAQVERIVNTANSRIESVVKHEEDLKAKVRAGAHIPKATLSRRLERGKMTQLFSLNSNKETLQTQPSDGFEKILSHRAKQKKYLFSSVQPLPTLIGRCSPEQQPCPISLLPKALNNFQSPH